MKNSTPTPAPAEAAVSSVRRRRWRAVGIGLAVWAVLAYLVAPELWSRHFAEVKPLAGVETITRTSDGHPGDPLNIALEGREEDVVHAMLAAGWYPADPITLSSSLKIAADSVLRRPDDMAPVSPLYLFGRKQDMAFELPVPGGPRHRHHVRFWRWDQQRDGLPVWFGAATYDERAGLSYTTGQITHHIGPDVDAERDLIVSDLAKVGWEAGVEWIDNFQTLRESRNGGGDLWRTDGRLAVVRLAPPKAPTGR
ncbi:MAG: LssY C-terminal domain-containing protein [Rubrivivax sp.]|nr:LssY C-terminal domain-containing protein [Rubrivivax sp.]